MKNHEFIRRGMAVYDVVKTLKSPLIRRNVTKQIKNKHRHNNFYFHCLGLFRAYSRLLSGITATSKNLKTFSTIAF